MSAPNVWSRSREKLRRLPEMMARCPAEASAYGRCVAATTAGKQELKKDLCAQEFAALKACFLKAAKTAAR